MRKVPSSLAWSSQWGHSLGGHPTHFPPEGQTVSPGAWATGSFLQQQKNNRLLLTPGLCDELLNGPTSLVPGESISAQRWPDPAKPKSDLHSSTQILSVIAPPGQSAKQSTYD